MVAQLVEFSQSTPAPRNLQSTWHPMEAIVDLLIDWDLTTVEITLSELAEWLGTSDSLCKAALDQLACLAGVRVHLDATGSHVAITVDVDACPLTAAPGSQLRTAVREDA